MFKISSFCTQHQWLAFGVVVVLFFSLSFPRTSNAMTQPMEPAARAALLVQLESIMAQLVVLQELVQALMMASQNALETTQGTVTELVATIDFLTQQSVIDIVYTDQPDEQFELETIDKEEVVKSITEHLSIDEEEITSRIQFSERNATVPVDVEFRMRSSRDIAFVTTQANGEIIDFRVPQTEIDALIQSEFGGLATIYDAIVDNYAAQLERGQRPEEVLDFIAELTDIARSTLDPILTIDISSRYQRNASSR